MSLKSIYRKIKTNTTSLLNLNPQLITNDVKYRSNMKKCARDKYIVLDVIELKINILKINK